LVEPFGVPEIHCSGVGPIYSIGHGELCLVLWRNVQPLDRQVEMERRVVGYVLGPMPGFVDAVQQIRSIAPEQAIAAMRMMGAH
jgi:hypothetical protein